MKNLPKISLLAGAIAFVIGLILSITQTSFAFATANGWLDLSLVLAVFSIAIKMILLPEEKIL